MCRSCVPRYPAVVVRFAVGGRLPLGRNGATFDPCFQQAEIATDRQTKVDKVVGCTLN